MNENRYQLTKDEERMIAELHESKFFAVLLRLVEVLDGGAMVSLKSKATSDSDMRYWQGYTGGVADVPLTVAAVAQKIKKQNI